MRVDEIKEYHAHLYYDDQAGLEIAQHIAQQLAELYEVQVGRFHQKKSGTSSDVECSD